ncbi:MAG: GntR family transcriptional regulator [Armatimonadota bacterium]
MGRLINSTSAADNPEYVLQKSDRFYLDASSPVPLYHQMEQIILQHISQEGTVGKMLPAETDLMVIFNVSRITVKKALENLANKGLLDRRRALGTRITRPQITEDLARLTSYTEEMESKGFSIRTNILFSDMHVPDAYVKDKLELGEGERTLCVRRLRGTNEVFPVVLLQTEIPTRFGISSEENFAESLYGIIEEKYHIPIVGAVETIGAGDATAEQAKSLGISRGDSVLVMERLTYTSNNVPLEFVRAVYRPDRYQFSIRLKR